MRFWYSWPSWLVELVSGLALTVSVAGGTLLVTHWPTFLVRLAVVTVFSLLYELFFDVNGWSLKDVLQREIGLGVAVTLWGILA